MRQRARLGLGLVGSKPISQCCTLEDPEPGAPLNMGSGDGLIVLPGRGSCMFCLLLGPQLGTSEAGERYDCHLPSGSGNSVFLLKLDNNNLWQLTGPPPPDKGGVPGYIQIGHKSVITW